MDERPEPERTRCEGIPSIPITLADGQVWGLALPSPRLRPKVVASVDPLGRPIETIRVETVLGYPLEIRRLIDDLRTTCEGGTAEHQYDTLIRLASALIRRAHEIGLADAVSLLKVGLDDLPSLVGSVLWVVTGECLETPDSSRKNDVDG
jgi:hypothetical protein